MDTGNDVLAAVQRHLHSYGVDLHSERPEKTNRPDTRRGRLRFADTVAPVHIVLVEPTTLTAVARLGLRDESSRDQRPRTLVIGRHVNERSAAGFRDAGIAFADAAGNAHIRLDNALIDVRGRRAPDRPSTGVPEPRSSNLFSTGRAQVTAALLTWPSLAERPVREIAHASGVSTGQAHSAIGLLGEAGYLEGRRLRAGRFDELVDLWTAAYPQGLGRKLTVASYTSTRDISEFRDHVLHSTGNDDPDTGLALSGESVPGLGLTRPRSVTVYAPDWSPRQAAQNRWRAATSATEADVHVRRRFWAEPESLRRTSADAAIAPWPIVYADLMSAGDERLAQVATTWRARHEHP